MTKHIVGLACIAAQYKDFSVLGYCALYVRFMYLGRNCAVYKEDERLGV